MAAPSLSVVMPNYNHGRFLGQSLKAIIDQSFPPREIIVVDDGSDDDSVEIVAKLARQWPNLRLLRNSTNHGVCYSLNRALAACGSDYVYCASADDLVLPGFFEKSMTLLAQHPHAGLCCAHCSIVDGISGRIDDNPSQWSRSPIYFSPREISTTIDGGIIPGHTAIIRRSALIKAGGAIGELKWHWDWFANLVIGFRQGVCFIPETVALLRVLPNSYSASGRRSAGQHAVLDHLLYLLVSPAYGDVLPLFQHSTVLRHFAPEIARVAVRNHDHWEQERLRLIERVVYEGCGQLLLDDDARIREGVCMFLGSLGYRAKETIEALLQGLRDEDAYVRFAAADALGKLCGDGRIRVPISVRLLRGLLLNPPPACRLPAGSWQRPSRLSVSSLMRNAGEAGKGFIRRAVKNRRGRQVVQQIAKKCPAIGRLTDQQIQRATAIRALSARRELSADRDAEIVRAAARALGSLRTAAMPAGL
jgi:glycosyltransferase involved in cell wall biosynthesis